MSLTLEEARSLVGETVRIASRGKGRPHMGRLVQLVAKDVAAVVPGGHKKLEYVALTKLDRWKKGEHESAHHRHTVPPPRYIPCPTPAPPSKAVSMTGSSCKPEALPLTSPPAPAAPPQADSLDALAALERAIKADLDAELRALEAKAEVARARTALALSQVRRGA